MPRRDIVGGAVSTTVATTFQANDLSIALNNSTGWPTGVNGPFYVTVYTRNAADGTRTNEEKVLVASRSGSTLTVANTGNRGVDGTTAQQHAAGAIIEHTLVSVDLDEANAHIYDTTRDDHTQYLNVASAAGDGLSITGRVLAVATDTSTLETNADLVRVKNNGITNAKLAQGAANTLVGNNTGGTANRADLTVAQVKTLLAYGALASKATVDAITDFGPLVRPVQMGLAAAKPGSPSPGDLFYELDTGNLVQYQSATTGWTPPWNTAWGLMAAPAQVTSSQASITTATDLTNLTTGAVTYVANRRVKISCEISAQGAAGGAFARLDIKEGATILNSDQEVAQAVSTSFRTTAYQVPTAGSHTYKLTFGRTTGADTLTMVASATDVAWIMVEDLGPNAAPA